MQSLAAYPPPPAAIERIRDYPAVCGTFAGGAVSPFFGANVPVRSRRL
ncbi:MAG: hypothetical protein LBD13_07100 [Spirochaetaceae bacterium]|nr:hypothetical protein [Spirochaetaceae bacterium]